MCGRAAWTAGLKCSMCPTPRMRPERAAALELLVRAFLEQQRRNEAAAAIAELEQIAATAGTRPLRAVASLAAGIAASRSGNANAARQQLEDAVDLFNESGAPFDTARAASSSRASEKAR